MKTTRLVSALLLAVLTTVAVAPPGTVQAATLTVNTLTDEQDGSCGDGDCSLRDAIDWAGSGDTIVFAVSGTIVLSLGELAIYKDLTIGGPGPELLTVSGGGASRVFSIGNYSVTIADLTITDGDPGSYQGGGGIYARGSSSALTLRNTNVTGNTAWIGGGVYAYRGSITIEGGRISDNVAEQDGGGVYTSLGGRLSLTEGEISGNSAEIGGGLYAHNCTMTVSGGAITGNHAEFLGGGIRTYGGSMAMTGGEVSYNTCENYGGGIHSDGTNVALSGGQIYSNTAWLNGGGIEHGYGGLLTQSGGSSISYNIAVSRDGGGIYIYSANAILSGGQISNNTAAGYGGAVMVRGEGTVTLDGGQIKENHASHGGGVYVDLSSAGFNQTSGSISYNTASSGGGIGIGAGTATVSGGEITYNEAGDSGGGVASVLSQGAFTQTGSSLIAYNNAAWGGGAYISGSGTFLGGRLEENSAAHGGGVYVAGGDATMGDGHVVANWASSGGGIYVSSGRLTLNGGEITGNTAEGNGLIEGGGGMYVAYGSLILGGGEMSGNTAVRGSGLYNLSGTIDQTTAVTVTDDIYQRGGTWNGGGGRLTLHGSLGLAGGVLHGPSELGIGGDLVYTGGAFDSNGGHVVFEGVGVQTLDGSSITFYSVTVSSGVTVTTEAVVSVDGCVTLLPGAVTRETRDVDSTDALAFGLATVTITPTVQGTLSSLQVTRTESAHPHAWVGIETARYWSIFGSGSGYTVTLTLPHGGLLDPYVCRYAGGMWEAGRSSFGISSVTRDRITSLSDWAVSAGEPSAVTLVRFGAAPHSVWAAVGGLVATCGVLVLGGLRRWARRVRE